MRWFKDKEFVCKCCGELPPLAQANVRALVENVLDPAREMLGRAIQVNSGYRCAKHNLECGGVKGSQHLCGEAADICPVKSEKIIDKSFTVQDLVNVIKMHGVFDQLIVYPTFVHVSYKRNGANRHQVLKSLGNKRYVLANTNCTNDTNTERRVAV